MKEDLENAKKNEDAKEILKFDDISMQYHTLQGAIDVFSHFTLSVYEGEFVSVIGPSGCGKSTLLSLAAGLLWPDEGSVLLHGKKLENKGQGYMLQTDQLFPWLTVEKNAQLGLRVQGKLTKETIRETRKLLENCGLADFVHAYPNQLSGGMRQRAALVRTLALDPEILLLDEPFSALDAQTRLRLSEEVSQKIAERKKTAILVTHDIAEAISMSDRVVVLGKRPRGILQDHRLSLQGPPLARRMNPLFQSVFDMLWKELKVDG